MKLYTFPFAPNPRKVHTYLGEKGIDLPLEWVDLTKGEQKLPGFLARNPLGNLPVLELEGGGYLTESLVIIEYLEELHPDPPMIGREPLERARVRRLERIADIGVLGRVGRIVHATRSPLPGVEPNPAMADQLRAELPAQLAVLDDELGDRSFLAGAAPTIADCTFFAALEMARMFQVEIPARFASIARWYAAFGQRPSTRIPAAPEAPAGA